MWGRWTAILALAVLLAGCGATSQAAAAGSVWAQIRDEEGALGGPGGQGIKGMAAGGPGLVAVGVASLGDDRDAAVWTSPDGLTWTRVPHDEANLGGPNWESMNAVTAGGPGLVAVGVASLGDDSDAAVWTSPDGLTWTRVPHDEVIFGGDRRQVMNAVVAGGPGLVAVGYDEAGAGRDESGGAATDAAVWTSADGLTWTRIPHDEAALGGHNSQGMNGVAAGGPGLVAVGYDNAAEGRAGLDSNAAVWTSPDGITWTRVPDDQVFGNYRWQMMNAVTLGGPGLVAVGYDGAVTSYDAAVWTSPDGVTWTRVPHDEEVFGNHRWQMMNAVAAGGPGLVAVGVEFGAHDPDATVWTSPDGVTWTRVPHDKTVLGGFSSQGMNTVMAGGPGVVAAGNDTAMVGWVPRDSDAAVWVSPPPG
jgi:hypothetical protein